MSEEELETVVFEDEDNTLFDETLPDEETTDLMLEAMAETVVGTESYTLSNAQHFAAGVLMAGGYISPSVTGNESLFSGIGEGASAFFKWIKDLFGKIWGLFFKKDSSVAIKEAKEELGKLEDNLDKLDEEDFVPKEEAEEDTPPASAQAQPSASAQKRQKAKLSKAKVDQVGNNMERTLSNISKSKELIEKNSKSLAVLADRAERDQLNKEATLMKELAAAGEELAKKLSRVDAFLAEIKKHNKGMVTKQNVKKFVKEMDFFLTALEQNSKGISSLGSKVDQMIKDAEKYATRKQVAQDDNAKATMAALRAIMNNANSQATLLRNSTNGVNNATTSIAKTVEYVYAA